MSTRVKFRKLTLEQLPVPPVGKRQDYYDLEVPKLLIRITSSGSKTFYVRRKKAGTDRLLIGSFPDVSIEQARKKALELLSALSTGEDPHEERKKARAELTFGELWDIYIEQHAKIKGRAWQEMSAVFRRYLTDWRTRKLASIRKSDVQARLIEIGERNGHVAANHTLTYARAAINWCIRNEITSANNPWVGARKFRTKARERFLKPDELNRFIAALNEIKGSDLHDYVYVSLFTGARRSNVLSMRWSDIDFDLGTWTMPETKNGDSQVLPLTAFLIDLLEKRRYMTDGDYVFPGGGKTGHLVELKRRWAAFIKESDIHDIRIHDLRRTLGSYMAMGNQSLHMIGKVLGHKSPTATQIYSRFANDPVRMALEKAHVDMFKAGGIGIQNSEPESCL